MELSRFTDYALRTLIFAGIHQDRTVTVPQVAAAYGISEHHLVKIIHRLGTLGVIQTRRGRSGGFQLATNPAAINIGSVVRKTESLALVECLRIDGGACPIDRACALKGVLAKACEAFLETLDEYTLEDLLTSKRALLHSLSSSE